MPSNEYIKNKIGFIPPNGWKAERLGKLAEINQENLSPTKTDPELEINYIDLGAVEEGRIKETEDSLKFKDAPSRAKRVVREGDIIMATVRPYLKGFAVADESVDKYICSTGFAVLTPKNGINSEFIFHNLFTEALQRQFHQLTVGSSYPALNNSDVKKLLIPLPKNETERKKIGDILSTWDRAISTLEQLIEAKKRYKKGLMQQLLSGKKRFPEFEGESWVEVRLGEFFEYYSNKNKDDEDLPIMSCSKVHGITRQENIFDKRVASKDITGYKIIKKNDLVFDPMLLWDASIGFVKEVDKGVISPAYSTFKFKDGSGYRPYFEFLFDTHYMKYNYKAISQGTNKRRRKAPKETFLKIPVNLPQTIKEQKKIANTLLAVQKEIDLLQQEIDLIKKQKKGLMQQLLTAKKRVSNLAEEATHG